MSEDGRERLLREQAKLLRAFEEKKQQDEVARKQRNQHKEEAFDLAGLLGDADLIQEQQKILQDIAAKKKQSEGATSQPNGPNSVKLSRKEANVKANKSMEDSVRTMSNGERVRLNGMKHVYASVANGTAVLVQCPNCHTCMQVNGRSSKPVYCVVCQQISHLDQCLQATNNYSSSRDDAHLAVAVQRQELQTARKMGKTGST